MLANASSQIAIVVVNWNGKADTLACLGSLDGLQYANRVTLVVDNGSRDDSVAEIARRHPEVEILELGENTGFAAGANAGIHAALRGGADYVLLLNNDTTVETGLLGKLLAAAESIGEPALIGPVIYLSSTTSEVWAAGARLDSQGASLQPVTTFDDVSTGPVERDALLGTALLIDRRILDSVGFLDEQLFLYWEDFDFCSRARRAGYRCYLVPAASVWHRGGASLGDRSPVRSYYAARNSLVWARRHGAKGDAMSQRVASVLRVFRHHFVPPVRPTADQAGGWSLVGNLVRIPIVVLGRFLDPVPRAALRGIADYVRGRLGQAPASVQRFASEWTGNGEDQGSESTGRKPEATP